MATIPPPVDVPGNNFTEIRSVAAPPSTNYSQNSEVAKGRPILVLLGPGYLPVASGPGHAVNGSTKNRNKRDTSSYTGIVFLLMVEQSAGTALKESHRPWHLTLTSPILKTQQLAAPLPAGSLSHSDAGRQCLNSSS
jgi:hypothetical protein